MSARRTLDETRKLILDAAAELLVESGLTVTARDLTLIDACRRAGLSTAGSGYKIWPNQHEFQAEALRHLLEDDSQTMVQIQAVADAAFGAGDHPPLRTLIRVASIANARAVIGSDAFRRYVALWLASGTDPALESLIMNEHLERVKSLEDLYGMLLTVYRREMRPPYTLTHFVTVVEAVIDGLALNSPLVGASASNLVLRPTGSDGASEEWHLFGCAIESIVETFTQETDN